MTKPNMTNTLALVLATTLAGCAQFSVMNLDKVDIPDTSAGHYFIQKALNEDWFAHVKQCENGATRVEVIAAPRFIAQLDKGPFANKPVASGPMAAVSLAGNSFTWRCRQPPLTIQPGRYTNLFSKGPSNLTNSGLSLRNPSGLSKTRQTGVDEISPSKNTLTGCLTSKREHNNDDEKNSSGSGDHLTLGVGGLLGSEYGGEQA
ncbi:hypothetical protein [Aeromonas veronii]|uniref:hypothetical protein n=1 Tax=Aeromonas veronii TaxID=654 RepID=UPI0011305424|nr:hypothetical protein [Aeromonas veronii]